MAFSFENLIVYQKALAWAQSAETICAKLKRSGSRSLANQLSRASVSILRDIAQGNGRWHRSEKRQFLWSARGAVFECVAILQLLRRCEFIDETEYREGEARLEELTQALSGLLLSFDSIKPRQTPAPAPKAVVGQASGLQ